MARRGNYGAEKRQKELKKKKKREEKLARKQKKKQGEEEEELEGAEDETPKDVDTSAQSEIESDTSATQ